MALFESKATRAARRQLAIQMGKKKVQDYVYDCRKMAEKYTGLAKRALAVGNQPQCDQFLLRRLQYNGQANKYESFALKMEDLILRGQMSGAMSGLVGAMAALNKEMRAGISAAEMQKAVNELNVTVTCLEQTEAQFELAIGNLNLSVGGAATDSAAVNIPQELQGEIDQLRRELLDEVAVQEKVTDGASGRKGGSGKAVDTRITEGLQRLRKLKGGTQ